MRAWESSSRGNGVPDPWWHTHRHREKGGVWREFRSLCGKPWTLGIAHVSSGGSSLCRYRSDAIWNLGTADDR